MSKYPPYIENTLRNELDWTEQEIQLAPPDRVFRAVLEWEGIIGYTEKIKGWIEDIYGVRLNESTDVQSERT